VKGKVLIGGVGNIFLGDDGFGVEVLRRLAERELPENVCLKDFGIRGFDLTYALMENWDLVVLVDATQQGGAPGTLYVIEHDTASQDGPAQTSFDPHGMHPIRAMDLVRAMGAHVPHTIVIGCEPEHLGGEDGQMGLSTVVAAAVDEAVVMAVRIASKGLAAVTAQ
jgi:hydrogenase maturation protease